jgi:hypothetical protein
MKKRIVYIALTLALIAYVVNVIAVLIRIAYQNQQQGFSWFDGVVWKNVFLPGWLRNKDDEGWKIDAIGKAFAFVGVAYLIVKKKIKTIR